MRQEKKLLFVPWLALVAFALALSGNAVADGYSPDQIKGIRVWAHSLSVQAGTYCASPVGMYNLR
jgi:hypothetical protein